MPAGARNGSHGGDRWRRLALVRCTRAIVYGNCRHQRLALLRTRQRGLANPPKRPLPAVLSTAAHSVLRCPEVRLAPRVPLESGIEGRPG